MPPSQLKRLKASLREQGVTGTQRSKKQKLRDNSSRVSSEKWTARRIALDGIREQFNLFEVKKQARPTKFAFANEAKSNATVVGRPGVTKGRGEETRRKTLLKEMQRRGKVGGIVDRRFGEDDPTMAPEEKALQRFVKEQEKGSKKASMFDLEDGEDESELTHMGRSLGFQDADSFDELSNLGSEGSDADEEGDLRGKKRRRLWSTDEVNGSEAKALHHGSIPEKPKTKQEAMKEVIAKSKFHRYERQKAKEDDDELRAELDEGLPDIFALLNGKTQARLQTSAEPHGPLMNPDRAALVAGKDRNEADREYDKRVRQLALDARSKPTQRTKTEEEIASEEAERLRNLEEQRQRRMRGEDVNEEKELAGLEVDEDYTEDDAAAAGLGPGIPVQIQRKRLDVEDEDEFVLDDDLIANESDAEALLSVGDSSGVSIGDEDEDTEFVEDLISQRKSLEPEVKSPSNHIPQANARSSESSLAFTFPCPKTHEEFLNILGDVPQTDTTTVIRRIRALYHPKLSAGNQHLLGTFSVVLVDHVSYMTNQQTRPAFETVESIIRHIHSLAKTFSTEIASAFRRHLRSMYDERPLELTAGDLVIFTAVGTIFPTSDHFHQVVTPAILTMTRYLGQKIPRTLADLARGLFLCTLCVNYQRLSKRYIPEVVNFLHTVLATLAPSRPKSFGPYPIHDLGDHLRLGSDGEKASSVSQLNFWAIEHVSDKTDSILKSTLLRTSLELLDMLSALWEGLSAYPEIFYPHTCAIEHYFSKSCFSKLADSDLDHLKHVNNNIHRRLAIAIHNRRDLELHHHRPLAIKTAIPKFEEGFHPDKHYDPDRERSELRKLKAEHKRERKGALRELRKDASFIAREQLKEKIERDEAYERKQRQIIAEIQGEEGRERNAYEREKRARRGKR